MSLLRCQTGEVVSSYAEVKTIKDISDDVFSFLLIEFTDNPDLILALC